MSVHLNMLRVVCINLHYTSVWCVCVCVHACVFLCYMGQVVWNKLTDWLIDYAEFDKMHGFYKFLTQTYNKSNINNHLHTELVQTKFNMGTLCLDRLTIIGLLSLSWMCVLSDFNSQLAHVPARQCLNFCDDSPSVAMPNTLTNPQNFRSKLFGGQFCDWMNSGTWDCR